MEKKCELLQHLKGKREIWDLWEEEWGRPLEQLQLQIDALCRFWSQIYSKRLPRILLRDYPLPRSSNQCKTSAFVVYICWNRGKNLIIFITISKCLGKKSSVLTYSSEYNIICKKERKKDTFSTTTDEYLDNEQTHSRISSTDYTYLHMSSRKLHKQANWQKIEPKSKDILTHGYKNTTPFSKCSFSHIRKR